MIVWQIYNKHLVDRITRLWDFSFLETWDEDLRKMNALKVGRPFKFPIAFILFLALLKVTYGMPYRSLEAMLIGLRQLSRKIQVPDFTTIFRRVEKLVIQIHEKKSLQKSLTR